MIRTDSRLRRPIAAALACLLLEASVASLTLSDDLNRAAVEIGVEGSQIDAAKAKRLEWFHEAKYGLFIHWGLYAVPAGQWKGRRIPGIGEWIMNRAQIPVKEYEQLARQFNPVKFNADEWVQLAKDAGMKYIVITSKHHDGFALYDSKVSTWDIVDATPFKRDVLKELAAACAQQGIRLGFYYSQAQDWHEPNGAGNTWDFLADETKKDFDQYLRDKAEPQVRELLTDYGPVALIWFDTPRLMTTGRAQRFVDLLRSLQPNTLIDGRLGMAGDYVTTGDNVIPPDVQGEAWEVPATLNHTWGYRTDDHDWKSPQTVIFKLIDIVSKGGNYLLNVGPTGRRRDSATQPGRAAHGWTMAARQRRGRLRRRRHAIWRRAWGAEREGRRQRARRAAVPPEHAVALHDQARQVVRHLLRRAARAVCHSGVQEPRRPRLSPRRRHCGEDHAREGPHLPAPRSPDSEPDRHRRRRRVRRATRFVNDATRVAPARGERAGAGVHAPVRRGPATCRS